MPAAETITLDLRGSICPYTLISSKDTLDRLAPGQDLVILVDYFPALRSVISSVEQDGHEVSHYRREQEGHWTIWARRGCSNVALD